MPDGPDPRVQEELDRLWAKFGHEQPFGMPREEEDIRWEVTVTLLIDAPTASDAMDMVDRALDVPTEWRTMSARPVANTPEYEPPEDWE